VIIAMLGNVLFDPRVSRMETTSYRGTGLLASTEGLNPRDRAGRGSLAPGVRRGSGDERASDADAAAFAREHVSFAQNYPDGRQNRNVQDGVKLLGQFLRPFEL
jgi:hypothetical protein